MTARDMCSSYVMQCGPFFSLSKKSLEFEFAGRYFPYISRFVLGGVPEGSRALISFNLTYPRAR